MPTITPADWTTLARLEDLVDSAHAERPVKSVTTAPRGLEGEGFPVRRAFAGVSMKDLDPFVHMDQMGEVDYAPGEPKGTPWHPHRGFETVTYMIDGRFAHQDSHGGGGLISGGDTQWMTAGGGILHIETPPEELVVSGGLFHGIQLWVNLPSRDKMIPPAYQGLVADQVVLLSSPQADALLRVVAGDIGGHRGPGSTHTPMAFVHASLARDARVRVPWNRTFNALVYVLAGSGHVGSERRPIEAGQLVTFGPGDFMELSASRMQDSRTEFFEVLLLGGEPIGEPVEHYGPFVMNNRQEIAQALEDFQAGRLGQIPTNALMPYKVDDEAPRVDHTGI